jgi:hypothetical protein
MSRSDWAELLANPRLLWSGALRTLDELRDAWELRSQPRPSPNSPKAPPEASMTLRDAGLVLRLPRGTDGPILEDLVDYCDDRLAEATDEEQRAPQPSVVPPEPA